MSFFDFSTKKKTDLPTASVVVTPTVGASADGTVQNNSLQAEDINQILYKRNVELATKNKALSLLGSLYAASISILDLRELTQQIAKLIRDTLNYESVSIFLYEKDKDDLKQIGSDRSDKYSEQVQLLGVNMENPIIVEEFSKKDYFDLIVNKHRPILNREFGFVMGGSSILTKEQVKILAERAHLKSSIAYPIALKEKVLGMLVITLNRDYDSRPDYEKQIIASIADVISLAMDKVMAYEALNVANEKLKGLDKLKTEFLSLASHQLRSPLTAIKGYTSMLLDGSFGEVGPKQKEAIDRVFQSSVHLAHVVEDLLNVSKIEAGGMQYQMDQFDLEKAAKDLATDLSITAQKKGLSLTFTTDNKSPYMLNGDMEKIRQVILNVIDNSIKYTKTGGIIVSLTKDEANKLFRIAVTDTGMGISPEEKNKLFQKFSRGEGGKTNTSGSGLGLYLAKQISEAHGGRVVIDSPGVGKGSTFLIELKMS